MKRIIMLTLLIAAGVAFAASSGSEGEVSKLTTTNQPLVIYCWEGEGTPIWTHFEIYYHQDPASLVGRMWGTWWRGDELGGWIEGRGYPDPTAPSDNWIAGEGTFGGDDQGGWQGTFILNRECWGAVWNMEGITHFEGEACD
jgi:hypothetical protein